MQMLGITVSIKRMVRAAAVRWYEHVLRREESNILRVALNLELTKRKKSKVQRLPGKKQVEALINNIGLRKEDMPLLGKNGNLGLKQ